MKLKTLFLSCGLILLSWATFAQQLTPKEKSVFDEIAYKRMQAGNYEVISKWAVPIRYKVFGDTTAYILKEIDSTFNQLKSLTQLDIKRTNDDDDANFLIVVGLKDIGSLSVNLQKYMNSFGGFYYRTNKKSEVIRGEYLIVSEKYTSKADVRHALKKSIVKLIGFFNTTESAPSSLFYSNHNGKLKIDAFDAHLISTLYLPALKSGMTKEEVDQILK